MTVASISEAVVGRDAELAAIREFFEARLDRPRALFLEGEAGIGKTTLLAAAEEEARLRRWQVLGCRPAAAEAQLAFAALTDAFAEVLDSDLTTLPEPQRAALLGAVRRVGTEVDRLALSMGVLNLLRGLARGGHVALFVDDAQWLDEPSAHAFSFALRRLALEPVAVITSHREGESLPLAFGEAARAVEHSRLPVRALSLGAIARIVRAQLSVSFSRPVLLRIYDAAGGNPFFALELARAAAEAAERGDVLTIPESLRELVRSRLAALPDETRAALLVVAALGQPQSSVVAAVVASWEEAVAPAVDAGVLELVSGRVRFTHPLLGSAVYADAPEHRRRSVHRTLADVVDEAEQRGWHLALATERPNERVAAKVANAAVAAAARGAPETAAELAEQARRLTPPSRLNLRAGRALDAALYAWSAGDARRSEAMLLELIESLPPSPTRAAARQLLVKIVDDVGETLAQLDLALEDAAGAQSAEASVLNLRARQRMWGGDFAGAIADAQAAATHAAGAGSAVELAVALGREAHARLFAGEPVPHELLERAVSLERSLDERIPVGESPTRIRGVCALWDDDLETAWSLLASVDRDAQARSESWRAIVLNTLAEVELRRGRTAEALRAEEEATEIAEYWGVVHAEAAVLATAALVRGTVGDVDEARRAAERALELMRPVGYDVIVRSAERALGFLQLSLGDVAAVHAVLEPLITRSGLGQPTAEAAAADEIEALLGMDRLVDAEALLRAFAAQADRTRRPRASAAVARSAALVAAARDDLDDALGHADHAVELASASEPIERGRALLVLGVVRRRAKQRRAAREALESAVALFDALPAPLWAQRARAELERIGGRRGSAGALTPSERRVADLVLAGKTNREIAAELFVTVHTVEKTLTRAYAKLGVRSRTELAHRLADLEAMPAKR
ncbi:MAG: AAA family ATPase [Thermoleophilia bacterium]|nr:AAA family ATPase [Thermoleophilia bacterium]